MKPTDPQTTELSAETTELVELARQALGHMSPAQHVRGLQSLRSQLARRAGAPALGAWAAVAGGAVACGLAVALFLGWRHEQAGAPLSFRLEGADLQPGGYVEASPAGQSVLRFSDGSEVGLAEQTRLHVHSIDHRGAQITLEDGKAHAYIVHAPGTRWSFDAGPFAIGVTGTAFSLAWSAATHRLDVKLENGSVSVSGPFSDAPIAIRAGQWLTVRGSEVAIRNLGDESTSPEASAKPEVAVAATPTPLAFPDRPSKAESPSGTSPNTSAGARARSAGSASGASPHHWAADLANGKVAPIVDEAIRQGLDSTFAESSSDELSALADAARYTRHDDIARDAFFAIRRRFPRSNHALDAAFLLGRLAEAQGDSHGALSWFETYLSDAPNGTYASEALGRKMTVVQQLEGSEAARPVAEAYLRRFPTGTYAQAARALSLAR